MIIADTSVWISFLKNDDTDLVDILKTYLKRHEVFGVSAVFGELFQEVKSKREQEILEVIWLSLPKVSEEDLFIDAGLLSKEHKLFAKGVGLIDCYILAAAQKNDFALWTLDKKLGRAYDDMTDRY